MPRLGSTFWKPVLAYCAGHVGRGRAISLVLIVLAGVQSSSAEDLQLTLPPAIYAVAGDETRIFFDNVILSQQPEHYRFEVVAPWGTSDARKWQGSPAPEQVGAHPLELRVRDADGKVLATAKSQVVISPAQTGAGKSLRLLIVGDSLTQATQYPNSLARLLARPGNPTVTMLGTHRPSSAAAGVAHEGYGGWTWERFVTYAGDPPPPAGRPAKSPFVFADEQGQAGLDMRRYLREHCANQPPDVAFFLLGINDCFGANPDDPQAIDARIDAVLGHAETLLRSFREAAPHTALAIGLTTPPNVREAAFVANYQGRYHRWGWKRIQHRLVQREIEHFSNRQGEQIYLVPTELGVDPVDGYPENNAVHPNAVGYGQIADSLYAWLKWYSGQNR